MKIFGSIQRLITLVFQYGAYTHTVQPDSAASASSVLTLPKTTDTIVGRAQIEDLSNKTLLTASTQIADSSTNPKAVKFSTAGATASTATTLVAAQTGNISINLPIVASTLSTLAGTETLTNKKLTGGAASAAINEWTLPTKAGPTTGTPLATTAGNIMFDTSVGVNKVSVYDGTAWKAVGGGLIPVAIDKNYVTALASGKHYLLDAANASADITLNLEAGATESNIKVTVINLVATHKVIVDANGTEKIFYNDTDNLTVEFVYAETEAWAEFVWNGTKWLVNDNSNVLSGTFSGALTFTGLVTANLGVKPAATKGIDYSANTGVAGVTSQVLNWYEEGTFSPTVVSSGGGSGTYASQSGKFTRVGRVVNYHVLVEISNHTGSGTMKIGGLPYVSSSVDYFIASSILNDNLTMPTNSIVIAFIGPGESVISLSTFVAGSGTRTPLALDTSFTIFITGFYFV